MSASGQSGQERKNERESGLRKSSPLKGWNKTAADVIAAEIYSQPVAERIPSVTREVCAPSEDL